MPTPTVWVLQHVRCETLGTIADALESVGIAAQYVRIFEGQPVPAGMDEAAGLIVMGGPMGVYEHPRLEATEGIIQDMVGTFADELREARVGGREIVQQASEHLLRLQPIGGLVFGRWAGLVRRDGS